jgi:GR25 family glycosyltransferase involved in LPS biosynthesis
MNKVAYIFFGQVKNFDKKQFEAFQQNVEGQLKGYDVDYFLTTSKASEFSNKRHDKSCQLPVGIDCESMGKYFDFKEVFFDQEERNLSENIDSLAAEILKFGQSWGEDSFVSIKNSLKQLYGLGYFWNNFKKNASKYDLFILSRCDLFHTHAFDVNCLGEDYDLLTPYYDNLPQIDYGQFGGINDRFAVARNILSLAVYCSRYYSIKKEPEYYHAEKYLLKHVNKYKLNIGKIHNFPFLLNRANGQLSDFVGIEEDKFMNTRLQKVDNVYAINLDRRLDRLNKMYKEARFLFQRFSAVDSMSEEMGEEGKLLFPKTWKSRNKGEICCAISHFRLWEKLSRDKSASNYLILEDDNVFEDGFISFWNQVFSNSVPPEYSLIYLGGCQPWNKPRYKDVLIRYNDYFCTIKENGFFGSSSCFWHMNTNSYILSKEAAVRLCDKVYECGMDLAVDHFMQQTLIEQGRARQIFHLNPLMSCQRHELGNGIQEDKNSDVRGFEGEVSDLVNQVTNKIIILEKDLFEQDFIDELFDNNDYEKIFDIEMQVVAEDSVIIYSDMYSNNLSIYPKKYVEVLSDRSKKFNDYFEKFKGKNCILVHLSDEHCHAEIDHYKNFKHVFRQYYRKDAIADNVTFIPLGYKKGFKS